MYMINKKIILCIICILFLFGRYSIVKKKKKNKLEQFCENLIDLLYYLVYLI